MTRSVVLSLCAVTLMVLSASAVNAQTGVTLSLDLFYADNTGDSNPDAAANGTWQLYALSEGEGIAAVDVSIAGIVGTPNNQFLAPTPAFKTTFNAGATPYDVDQDSNAATLDMLFAQIPVTAPGPQDLQYDVGAVGGSTPNTDELGAVVDTSGSSMTDAVLLAFGTFDAGSAPVITTTGDLSGANLFTVEGTSTTPPAVGTIVGASPFAAQSRTNLGTLKGDVNLDGTFVDGADFGVLAGGFDGGVATDKLWQDGDVTGDQRVDAADVGQVFGSWTGDAPPAGAGEATGEYDPATGEISVSVNGVVNWYVEHVGSSSMTGDAAAGLPQAAGLVTDNDTRIGESSFAPFAYDQNLGNVAAAGLADDGSLRIFWNQSLGGALQSAAVSFAVIPEPTSLALAGLALCGVLATRRRRLA